MWGTNDTCGGYHDTCGGYNDTCGDIMSTMGVLSTMGYIFFCISSFLRSEVLQSSED